MLLFNSANFAQNSILHNNRQRNSRASQDVFSGTQKEREHVFLGRGHVCRGIKCQENEGGQEAGEQSSRNEVVGGFEDERYVLETCGTWAREDDNSGSDCLGRME